MRRCEVGDACRRAGQSAHIENWECWRCRDVGKVSAAEIEASKRAGVGDCGRSRSGGECERIGCEVLDGNARRHGQRVARAEGQRVGGGHVGDGEVGQ